MTTQGPEGPGFGPGGEAGAPPTEEEMQAALEEQMRRLTVDDVVVQTVVTLVNLGARRLGMTQPASGGEPERDLDQARLAIEATRALLPLLPGEVGPIRDALTQLQMAYAREAQGAGEAPGVQPAGAEGQPSPGGPAEPAPPPPGSAASDAERERARSKIWTPGGN